MNKSKKCSCNSSKSNKNHKNNNHKNNNHNHKCENKYYTPLPFLTYQPCNDILTTNSWFSPGVVECGCHKSHSIGAEPECALVRFSMPSRSTSRSFIAA